MKSVSAHRGRGHAGGSGSSATLSLGDKSSNSPNSLALKQPGPPAELEILALAHSPVDVCETENGGKSDDELAPDDELAEPSANLIRGSYKKSLHGLARGGSTFGLQNCQGFGSFLSLPLITLCLSLAHQR